MLHFSMRPPFTFERFLEVCREFIPEKDFQVLCTLPRPEQYSEEVRRHPVIRTWIEFDTAVRNDLVKIRAARTRADPSQFLYPGGYSGSYPGTGVMAAQMSTSILESEKILDEARWKALDLFSTGHYFDLDLLITYAYKLLILLRWENIRNADGAVLLETSLQE